MEYTSETIEAIEYNRIIIDNVDKSLGLPLLIALIRFS
jgi:hypothetical protein